MTQLWDDARILAWRADVIAQCNAEHAPTSQALSELPYVMMQEYNAELADLRAKLAAAEGVIEEANKMLTAARDANRDLTEKLATARNKTISLWYSIGDNQPLRSEGEDGEFVELWMDGGKLIMEDEREFRLEFPIGNTIALCRTGSDNAATGVIALVDRLLDEARDQGQRTVVWPETYSRRWFMRRLREELGIVGAAT